MTGGQSGGGLGGMLGGLFGGGEQAQRQTGATDGGANPLGALGDLLSSPVGKALIGGIAAFAMKEMLDND